MERVVHALRSQKVLVAGNGFRGDDSDCGLRVMVSGVECRCSGGIHELDYEII
jgi:hypothetical protein